MSERAGLVVWYVYAALLLAAFVLRGSWVCLGIATLIALGLARVTRSVWRG